MLHTVRHCNYECSANAAVVWSNRKGNIQSWLRIMVAMGLGRLEDNATLRILRAADQDGVLAAVG